MKESSKKKKSVIREWFNSIVFAVIAATLIRGLFMEAFAIPTSSMENDLLVGDHLFVSKMHYGTATPRTPLQLPLIHQTLPGTDIPEYLDWIQLPYYRLPGFTELKRNEEVVFHYPPEWERPVDMKTFYVKRCIALPGDTLEIRNTDIFVNGELQPDPEHGQSSYWVKTNQTIHPRVFRRLGIDEYTQMQEGYEIKAEPEMTAQLKELNFVQAVEEIIYEPGAMGNYLYPQQENLGWTIDYYGPVHLPKAGDRIALTKENLALYAPVILHYEDVDATLVDGKITIDGQEVTEYEFRQGYYFMMGDNRHNSEDSRFWGFVPEDHIVGKPVLVWFSYDKNADWLHKIRWSRLFKLI
uniref:Signal peptidase I n=1 Tax=Roseihalotalea indica TaxID=2867963 RepID=A0AA49JJH6_9BACT|nr:signal peptidase I [Tunicatimonas sp. TK19036]